MARDRVVVLGAQGVLGAFCAEALRKEGFDVVRAGRRPESSPDFRLVDVRNEDAVAGVCAEADRVLQTVPDPDYVAERVAVERGGAVLGIASVPLRFSFDLLERRHSGPGSAVIDAGLNPGVTTLVLADMLARHPDADRIEFGYTNRLSPRTSGGRAGFAFFFGQLATQRRRATATVPFPEPFGTRRCIEFSHGEEGWLGTFALEIAAREYLYFAPAAGNALLLALNRLGLLAALNTRALRMGRRRVPRRLSDEPKCDWIAIARGGQRVEAWTVEGRGDYRMTVACALTFMEAITTRPPEPGISRAQDALTLDDIREGCERRGIRLAQQPV